MVWLLLDTSMPRAAVAIVDDDWTTVLDERLLDETKRHAEHLPDAAIAVLGDHALAGVGVSVGPGSFIGVRTALSFGIGVARARGVVCVGVLGPTALAGSVGAADAVVVIDAKRGERYVSRIIAGVAEEPRALAPSDIVIAADDTVVGALHDLTIPEGAICHALPGPTGAGLLAALRGSKTDAPARPLYVRGADAKLPAHDPAARRTSILRELDSIDRGST